ncbi:hypothetical protein RRG08_018047 [Elysia crispata]|uniref:Uncharacterized protein n=1 Tax=Elysia crispata TaxID=231223 RepID=A0AAE1DE34_9GAST|nr:hypothetical protein RRG08_018047 [Elysia crispata]
MEYEDRLITQNFKRRGGCKTSNSQNYFAHISHCGTGDVTEQESKQEVGGRGRQNDFETGLGDLHPVDLRKSLVAVLGSPCPSAASPQLCRRCSCLLAGDYRPINATEIDHSILMKYTSHRFTLMCGVSLNNNFFSCVESKSNPKK